MAIRDTNVIDCRFGKGLRACSVRAGSGWESILVSTAYIS